MDGNENRKQNLNVPQMAVCLIVCLWVAHFLNGKYKIFNNLIFYSSVYSVCVPFNTDCFYL